MQYESIDVFTTRTIRAVKHGSDPALLLLRNPTGVDVRDRRQHRPAMDMTFEVMLQGREAVDSFRTFLEARQGRLVPFWLPSWDYDLRLVEDVEGPTNLLGIRRTEFVDNYLISNVHRVRRYLYFYRSGYETARYITTAEVIDADTEQITVDENLPDDPLGPDSYETICFLNYCRLGSDRIEIKWINGDNAIAMMPVHIIEYELETP